MKYHIKTYGCQMNYSDSERVAGVLEMAGYEKALSEDKADLVVINACSVRKSAMDRIAGNFKKYKKYKAENPNFKTVITGCVLESDKARFEKLFDLVIDVKEIGKLPERLGIKTKINRPNKPKFTHHSKIDCRSEFISESFPGNGLISPMPSKLSVKISAYSGYKRKILKQVQDDKIQVINNNKQIYNRDNYFQISPKYQSKITAYVPIMTGCNNFCSYCVVPYTRGREYSRPAEEVLDEIRNLVENGYKEIILLGQNVNSYKSQISNPKFQTNSKFKITNYNLQITNYDSIDFPILLRLINAIPGDFWIRFLTSHPKDMTKELIKTVAECEKCAEHIHLALQSGDDDILEKMNRKYTAKHYLGLIKLIRKHIPNAAISTDIIVGFPGETKKRFLHTAEVMEEAKFDMAYLNKYSPRPGTIAAKLADDVSWEEKKKREDFLNKVLKKTALENNQKYVGKIVEVLIDELGIKNNELRIFYGKTKSFKNVKIGLSIKYQVLSIKQGQFVKIKITRAGAWGLEGEIAE